MNLLEASLLQFGILPGSKSKAKPKKKKEAKK